MSTHLTPFHFNDSPVRVRLENDEPIFVANDVAPILGYARTDSMMRYLDDDEKGSSKWRTLGGDQEMSHLTEAGLYAAIMRSTAEVAKPFRRWVTHTVLPAIRRHGGYLTVRLDAIKARNTQIGEAIAAIKADLTGADSVKIPGEVGKVTAIIVNHGCHAINGGLNVHSAPCPCGGSAC